MYCFLPSNMAAVMSHENALYAFQLGELLVNMGVLPTEQKEQCEGLCADCSTSPLCMYRNRRQNISLWRLTKLY